MDTEITVRTGTPLDIHEMMDLSLAATEENGLFRPNPEKLCTEIWSSLNLHHGIVGIIGEQGKPLEAAILLRTEAFWYSDELCLIERAIYVGSDFRGGTGQGRAGRAARLCEFAKQAADALGLKLVIGVLSNQRTEAKVRLYQRQFGESAGAWWIYGGKTGAWRDSEATELVGG